MHTTTNTRVLLIDRDPETSRRVAAHLAEHYDVHACASLDADSFAVQSWRPHVVVLATEPSARHRELEELRRLHPRLPVVVVTGDAGQDLLLDLEAFAPTLPVRPSRSFSQLESAVAAACAMG